MVISIRHVYMGRYLMVICKRHVYTGKYIMVKCIEHVYIRRYLIVMYIGHVYIGKDFVGMARIQTLIYARTRFIAFFTGQLFLYDETLKSRM